MTDDDRLTVGVDPALGDESAIVLLNGRGEVVATSHNQGHQLDSTERMYRPGAVIGTAGADLARRTYLGPWVEGRPATQTAGAVTSSGLWGAHVSERQRRDRVDAEVRRHLDEVAAEWRRCLATTTHTVEVDVTARLVRPRRRWWPGR